MFFWQNSPIKKQYSAKETYNLIDSTDRSHPLLYLCGIARQRDILKSFERSVDVWKNWIRLEKAIATLDEELSTTESLPAKRKEQRPNPTKRDARREEFG